MLQKRANAFAPGDHDWHLAGGQLLFSGPINAHDVLVTPLQWTSAPNQIVAEADITPMENPGSSWAPSLFLYWSTSKWVSVGISGNAKYNTNPGGYIGTAPLKTTYRVRITWENGTVKLWGGPAGTEPALLRTAAAPESGPPPYLIVGKGFGAAATYTQPFLANDFTDVGAAGYVYIDNISVQADSQTTLTETFENGIDPLRWQLYTSPASMPKPPVDLEELFPNWVEPAQRGDISPPKAIYKENDWIAYRARYASDAAFRTYADSQINALISQTQLVMGYGQTEIVNMIPETTPLVDLFTPCPIQPEYGFPHGVWTWSPLDPDKAYCGGVAFPNETYPEEGVMTAYWGGSTVQTITYYNRQSYDFAGFQLSPSFTSYIRAKKVAYMSDQVGKIALLYRLTGDIAYAKQAKKILLRMAEVYPRWLLHSGYGEYADMDPKDAAFAIGRLPSYELTAPPNVPNRQLHAGYWMAGRGMANGMEGLFILPLVTSYDLIRDAAAGPGLLLSDADRLAVERDLFLEASTLFVADPAYNNKSIFNRTAAAAIGVLIGEPELVRFGADAFDKFLTDWYKPDGTPAETAAYGLQVLQTMWKLGEILNGYSDPAGYVPLPGQSRIDNYEVYNRPDYQMVFRALGDTVLPSLKYPPIGDSYTTSAPSGQFLLIGAKRTGLPILLSMLKSGQFPYGGVEALLYYPDGLDEAGPIELPDLLLPDWKLAYLRGGPDNLDSVALLNASDWYGHRHLDSLDLTYWANGGESLSDMGYLWDHPQQAMTVRSAAHNLVIVDKKNQRSSGKTGSIRLYTGEGPVHAAEAESNAYAETDMYRRTVVQVQGQEGQNDLEKPEYVVDFFRVRGGASHDLIVHAPTDGVVTGGIPLQLGGASEVSAYGLTGVTTAATAGVWTADWANNGGGARTKAWQVPSAEEDVYVGQGWGQRGKDDAGAELPYLVRHRDQSTEGSTFTTLYESYRTAPSVANVEPLLPQGWTATVQTPVGVSVYGAGWRDYVVSGTGSGGAQPLQLLRNGDANPVQFAGQLGVLSFGADPSAAAAACNMNAVYLAGEGRIEYNGAGLAIAGGQGKEGQIGGAQTDGFTATALVAGAEQWIGGMVYVKRGTVWTAYPVLGVTVQDGKTKFVTYEAPDGYPFPGGEAWKLVPYAYAAKSEAGAWNIVSVGGGAELLLPDCDPPALTLLGDNPLTVTVGAPYAEPGVSAWDGREGDLSSQVTVTGSVYTQAAGTYALTYRVADTSGNEATAVRTVHVTTGPDVIDQRINAGEADGDIVHSLVVKLRNSLKQAVHQLEKGDPGKAAKHIGDFRKHLDRSSTPGDISSGTRSWLELQTDALLQIWTGG
ncbi:immunoglobulin-like domain-containing protein [Paenibacillus oceani]|uniref:DUF5011 domain-containing protein n=1 Tax=Paenibacillus oceani TaxID=2772510 RepID=A0A927CHW4_9BACL|nr:immunoglobulin-like domain-containing protein [Paenibacillus oceani]MBD2866496.1 DUF5011 domain-containing protein [Paenibacillus oceani]